MPARVSPFTLVISAAVWLAVLALTSCEPTAPGVVRADMFGVPIVQVFVSFLGRLFGGSSSESGAAVGIAIRNLENGLTEVTSTQRTFVERMGGWLTGFVGVFKWLKREALVPLLSWLRERITWLKEWLKRAFGPLIKLITKIRKHILDFYAKYIRPALDVIDAIRGVLQVLGRLGVEWATELDRKLGKITSEIHEKFLFVDGWLRKVQGAIDAVITFDLLFQRFPFLRTLVRDAGYLNRIWWHVNSANVPDTLPPTPDDLGKRAPAQDASELREFLETGGGPKGAIIRELRAIAIQVAEGRQ